jgi:hypothetical protein
MAQAMVRTGAGTHSSSPCMLDGLAGSTAVQAAGQAAGAMPHQVGSPVAAAAEAAAHASSPDAIVSHSSRSTAGASAAAICTTTIVVGQGPALRLEQLP